MKKQLAFSWSVLNSWANYSPEEAVNAFLKKPVIRTPEQQAKLDKGSDIHEKIEKQGLVLVPDLQPGGVREKYGRVQMTDWLWFSYKFDYYVDGNMVDFKTGSFRDGMELQLFSYALCGEIDGFSTDKGHLAFVKETKKDGIKLVDHKVYDVSSKELNLAWDFIYTNAKEMKNYLLLHNLWSL